MKNKSEPESSRDDAALERDRNLTRALRDALADQRRAGPTGERTFRASTLLEEIGVGLEPVTAQRTQRKTLVETGLPRTLPMDGQPSDGDDAVAADRSFGRFQPRGVLGEGSMGVVLEAWDPELGRTVALKLIRNAHAVRDAAVRRFVAEARVTAQLDHPGIVPVHELGVTSDGVLFFVMKKVRGRSMREILGALEAGDAAARQRWTRHRLLSAFVQICQALAYAHDREVVHRDLKPENIMLGEFGEVVVMDWGVARIPELSAELPSGDADTSEEPVGSGRLTLHGTAVGTPGFMSPEAVLGERDRLGPHSDVWSLGAILFELLTWQPAYEGANAIGLMRAVIEGPPPDPAQRHPAARVPSDLAAVCVRALDNAPELRGSAKAMAEAVEAYLEGSAARALAEARLAEGRAHWSRHAALLAERDALAREIRSIERVTPPWTPPEAKRPLLDARARSRQLSSDLADGYENAIAACERALSHDRRCEGAHELLAEAYLFRLDDARARGDDLAARGYARRVKAHDSGALAAQVDAPGTLDLDTSPSGARVACARVERSGLVWGMGEERDLGATPLCGVELAAGSYLLTIRAAGYRETRYPVWIRPGRARQVTEPVPLYTDDEIGEGWVYVPRGPFVCGGDPQAIDAFPRSEPTLEGFFVQTLPVTAAAYAAFLSALHAEEPNAAWRRVPREISGQGVTLGQHWHRPANDEGYVVPTADRAGDRWSPRWPVIAVSWDDAQAYAEWQTARTGREHRLPLEVQWEKAARGVDGRSFPWGDEFDATLCLMRDSRPVNRLPEEVGHYATDVSIYGVRDVAGSIGEWCGEPAHRGDGGRRLVRGGSWLGAPRRCRVASRDVLDLSWVYPSVGFRLLRPAPRG